MTIKCLRQNKSLPAGHPSNPSAQVGPGNAEEGTLMQTNVQLCITTMSIHQSLQLIVHHWLGLKVQCIRELYSKFKPVNSDTEAKLFQSNSQWRRCWAVMSLRWPEVTVIVSHRQPLTFGAAALGVDEPPRFDRIIRTVITDCQTQFYRHHNWVIRGQHMRINIIIAALVIVARTLFGSHSTFGR